MAIPRSLLVDPDHGLCYHLVSRCVRRAWLCGNRHGESFAHRKRWIEERMLVLAESFAVDVLAYSVMSNHFHIVVYFDPTVCESWSDDEVARRWLRAFSTGVADQDGAKKALLADRVRLQSCRRRLGSLSAFMQHLKQPIAVRINREDGVKGHLFEQRFYSAALLDEDAVLAAMRYVDLNPARARIAKVLEEAENTSISRRLRATTRSSGNLDEYIGPVATGVRQYARGDRASAPHPVMPAITVAAYIALLEETIEYDDCLQAGQSEYGAKAARWRESVRLFRRGQRAYGEAGRLAAWLAVRRFRKIERSAVVLH
ncbi:MAG: transposase [Pseudomonadota bacterium]